MSSSRARADAAAARAASREEEGVRSGQSKGKQLDPKEWASREGLRPVDKKLYEASQKGDLEEAERLIKSGANVFAQDGFRQTALHYAAWKGQLAVARLLAAKMCERHGVDIQDKYLESPLYFAAACGHPEVCELLVESGANVNMKDKGEARALEIFASRQRARSRAPVYPPPRPPRLYPMPSALRKQDPTRLCEAAQAEGVHRVPAAVDGGRGEEDASQTMPRGGG